MKPLDILKDGLAKFSKKIKDRKDDINAKLSRRETISSADEQWLDYEANTVDKQRILDDLEAASDYKRGFAQLDETGKGIVKKLTEWAGVAKVAGNKQKCLEHEKRHKEPKKKSTQTLALVFTKKRERNINSAN
ncbi:hypothetical protein F5888DRAFT_1639369 [Russula emetica]|nr:hypothetical protein F5888DRAFT_1639369 [Russula emetica]